MEIKNITENDLYVFCAKCKTKEKLLKGEESTYYSSNGHLICEACKRKEDKL